MEDPPNPQDLEDALRASAAALRDGGVRFMLGGSMAAWVRGGPPSRKDLDLLVAPADADRAIEVLEAAGMRTERPPEDWLYKAWHEGTMIDLIFHPKGLELDDAVFERADCEDVFAIPMLVMSLEDLIATKLLVLDERTLDLEPVLQIARSLRERIDWEQVRARTANSPFAKAFFTLIEELGIIAPHAAAPAARRGRVRVLGRPDSGEAADRSA